MTRKNYFTTSGVFSGSGMTMLFFGQYFGILLLIAGLIMDFLSPLIADTSTDTNWIPVSREPKASDGDFFWVTDGKKIFESFYVAGKFIAAPGTRVTHYKPIPKPSI